MRITLHQGLGDTLYARPHIRALTKLHKDVAVETPFPQLFEGINVEFIKPQTRLLPTQEENIIQYPDTFWTKRTKFSDRVSMIYRGGLKEGLSIPKALDKFIKPEPYDFSLTPNPIWVKTAEDTLNIIKATNPICLVKLPTQRKDFNIPSRNPKMEYFSKFMEENQDYTYINITKVNESEWYDGTPPKMLHIDLPINILIGLISISEGVLCHPSFMLPLSIALGTPTLCLFGGYVKPELLLDERMGLDNLEVIAPEPFCNCLNPTHNCHKDIDERRLSRLQTA